MRGPKLAMVLAIAAIAVGVQNYVFFVGLDSPPVRSVQSDADESSSERARRPGTAGPPPPVLDLAALDGWLTARPERARNPFLTSAEAIGLQGRGVGAGDTSLPQLTGTLWSRARRVAWLDGRPLSEGDRVRDYRIAAIETSHVVLERGGVRTPLYVESPVPAAPVEAPRHGN